MTNDPFDQYGAIADRERLTKENALLWDALQTERQGCVDVVEDMIKAAGSVSADAHEDNRRVIAEALAEFGRTIRNRINARPVPQVKSNG